jgi:hypothetical protein
MIKYRIIKKDVVVDQLTADDAQELLMMQQNADPQSVYDVEQYEWNDPAYYKRLGRDPQLH